MPTAIRPLLWKIREAPVHILGTFHVGPSDGFALGRTFDDAFAAAKALVCEVGPRDKAIDPALLGRRSGSLAEDMGADLYADLLADSRYNASFEAMHPVAVILHFVMQHYLEVGLAPEHGVDPTLERQALAAGKACSGFETATDQISAMLTVDIDAVARGVDFFLNKPEFMLEIRDLLIRSFIEGDEGGIRAAREYVGQWSAALAAKLLREREARWFPHLSAISAATIPTVIAVGAIHLVGSEGLIDHLAASGIPADRIDT